MARKRKRGKKDDGPSHSQCAQQGAAELPEGVEHYTDRTQLPKELRRYFQQRHTIWSLYDQGIWMNEQAWYGVTQEPVATKIAQHSSAITPKRKTIILDAFCGVGGNTIAFALSGRWRRVYAIEKDAATLDCARRNAQVYGVEDKITWFLGDCFKLLGSGEGSLEALRELLRGHGVIFGSPPWGGPRYKSDEVFNLQTMQPYTIDHIHNALFPITGSLILYLPRTSDLRQIAKLAGEARRAQVVHYCTRASSRALCAYLGDFERLPLNA